jgi:NhaP-type Na+/H+ or K+/H+ antiporter
VEFNYWFVIVGVLLIFMALSSTILKRLPLTTSMLYLAFGLGLGPIGLGLIKLDPLDFAGWLERVTEIAVLVSLFTAGLKMRRPLKDQRWRPPLVLATLTMVVTVALIAATGSFLLGLPLGAAILLGAILAPTDPVLASDVQVEHVSDRDRLRFSLTGEAGLNDGTAFPFVMLGLGLLGLHHLGPYGARWVAVDVLWAAAAGLGLGWIFGMGVGWLTVTLRRRHEHALGLEDFLALGLIAVTYGAALLIAAYGFLAVFAAGVALRHYEMSQTGTEQEPDQVLDASPEVLPEKLAVDEEAAPAYMAKAVLSFSEQLERILELTVVLIIGGLLVYAKLSLINVLFVLILLLLIRPAAVYLTFRGQGTFNVHRPYIAWFGIRGIGSLYYLMYSIEHGLPKGLAEQMTSVTLLVIASSALLHGLSVTPLMTRYQASRGPAPAEKPA